MGRRFELLFYLTIAGLPAAFSIEWAARAWLSTPQAVQAGLPLIESYLRAIAWILAVGSTVGAIAGPFMIRRVARRRFQRLPSYRGHARERAVIGSFLLTSSAIQVPGVFAILAHGFGTPFLPCAISIATISIGIYAQYRIARSM